MTRYNRVQFRVVRLKWWPGYLVQQRSDFLSWWSTVARFQSLDEAEAECRALIRANRLKYREFKDHQK